MGHMLKPEDALRLSLHLNEGRCVQPILNPHSNKTQTFVSVLTKHFSNTNVSMPMFPLVVQVLFLMTHFIFSANIYGPCSGCIRVVLCSNPVKTECFLCYLNCTESGKRMGTNWCCGQLWTCEFSQSSMFFSITCCPLLVSFLLYNTTSPVCPEMPPRMSVQIMDFCWLQMMSNLYLYLFLFLTA